MRKLTTKQKNLLRKWVDDKEPKNELGRITNTDNGVYSVDDLTSDQWETLENINDTEILWQNCNRFIHDYRMSKVHN